MQPPKQDEEIIADTERWLERIVIGLNLCPFAKSVYAKKQVRYVVSPARNTEELRLQLRDEMLRLAAADPEMVDTTLLIHPQVLADFLDYNDFLAEADEVLDEVGLVGEIQIASFHPQYQFAGTAPDDIDNYTNRSPYPILHLLREASIERAVDAFADAADIFEKNIETMRRLGHEGWDDLNG